MQFEIIGADSENYFLMAFDDNVDMSKGVFFYKTPISFFDFIDMERPEVYFMMDIELFIGKYYDLMIRDDLLQIINKYEFSDIIVEYEE